MPWIRWPSTTDAVLVVKSQPRKNLVQIVEAYTLSLISFATLLRASSRVTPCASADLRTDKSKVSHNSASREDIFDSLQNVNQFPIDKDQLSHFRENMRSCTPVSQLILVAAVCQDSAITLQISRLISTPTAANLESPLLSGDDGGRKTRATA